MNSSGAVNNTPGDQPEQKRRRETKDEDHRRQLLQVQSVAPALPRHELSRRV